MFYLEYNQSIYLLFFISLFESELYKTSVRSLN